MVMMAIIKEDDGFLMVTFSGGCLIKKYVAKDGADRGCCFCCSTVFLPVLDNFAKAKRNDQKLQMWTKIGKT